MSNTFGIPNVVKFATAGVMSENCNSCLRTVQDKRSVSSREYFNETRTPIPADFQQLRGNLRYIANDMEDHAKYFRYYAAILKQDPEPEVFPVDHGLAIESMQSYSRYAAAWFRNLGSLRINVRHQNAPFDVEGENAVGRSQA